jgi:energy-coupling factor transporter transmembrane protein EcfT
MKIPFKGAQQSSLQHKTEPTVAFQELIAFVIALNLVVSKTPQAVISAIYLSSFKEPNLFISCKTMLKWLGPFFRSLLHHVTLLLIAAAMLPPQNFLQSNFIPAHPPF